MFRLGKARLLALLFALAILARPDTAAATPPHYDLKVMLDPPKRMLKVSGTIRIAAGERIRLALGSSFDLERFEVDGRAQPALQEGTGRPVFNWRIRAPEDRPARIDFAYSGRLDALDTSLDHREVLGLARALAGAQGAFLPAGAQWYPEPEGTLTYRISVIVPAGFHGIASGKLIEESTTAAGTAATFEADDPLPGIDLMAGPYTIAERDVRLGSGRQVRVRTYFHPELDALASGYLESAAGYLMRYDREIGPYPFAGYSIVSSPLPTGFGMPGMAYLGRQVLRLPFIRATSLGHEVLHDWWGNGVYPDYARGNWAEGLTTFMADYAYKEDQSDAAARAMRLGWLRDYAAVPLGEDRPLAAFVSRRHGVDQAVGYNKTAFVFFMLRDLVGAQAFRAGLQRFWRSYRFRFASWDDLRHELEAQARRDLSAFFAQWVTRSGAPALAITAARRETIGDRQRISIDLRQTGSPYRLSVPLRIHLEAGQYVDRRVELDAAQTRAVLVVPGRATAVSIDPDVRLFRRLAAQEIAPTLRQVMLDSHTQVTVAGDEPKTKEAATVIAAAMLEKGMRGVDRQASQAHGPILVIGMNRAIPLLLARLHLPAVPAPLAAASTYAYAWETQDGKRFAVVAAPDPAALAALARPLPHLGAQSYVVFDGARSVERGIWPREAPRTPIVD